MNKTRTKGAARKPKGSIERTDGMLTGYKPMYAPKML
jgi:hypothetical protein